MRWHRYVQNRVSITLEDADAELLKAAPKGWWVGRASFHEERNV